jgi:hypothetical protein
MSHTPSRIQSTDRMVMVLGAMIQAGYKLDDPNLLTYAIKAVEMIEDHVYDIKPIMEGETIGRGNSKEAG